ncbi:cation transporter dimerization domain-containing protein [Nostoc sp. CCY 9925]|uniref:cation transporter dimerization domain-containing protein n=1 Tax=Nostoc sp. CCY 9925 TaxID=3103865 RepID=UPI0039C75783
MSHRKNSRFNIQFHALRSRLAGKRRFISFHVLVPGAWTVRQGHNLCEQIELKIIQALPGTSIIYSSRTKRRPCILG